MMQQRPRQFDDEQAFNVNKKDMIHKSTYLSGVVIKSAVKARLQFLLGQTLLRQKCTGVGGSARMFCCSNQRDLDERFHASECPGFDLRSYCNTAKLRKITTSTSVPVASSSRKAVGVTIYRNINSFTDCNRVNIDVSEVNLEMKHAKAIVMSV
ncbi:hypothetical protein TNCV_1286901 [Trichonephila clavipes]|nr:hypothetical protein TNCV_1286901 [Trichonephila clavipes]